MHLGSILVVGLLVGQSIVPAHAADEPVPLSLDQARAWRDKGKALKRDAEAAYENEKAVCQSKAIAIACMSSAKERRKEAVTAAEVLEREGRRVERELQQQERAARAAKREAEAPGREAEQQADVERYREQEAKKAAEREQKMAEESAQLESRRSKLAAERAAQQEKLAARRAEDAKRAEMAPENARKAEERRRQHADRVKKIDERARQYAEKLKQREADEVAKRAAAANEAAR